MNAVLTVNEAELNTFGNQLFLVGQRLLVPVQEAMTQRFYDITVNNFGEAGEDRPTEWVALSPAYARKVGRPHATLEVTGKLKGAIEQDVAPAGGRVSVSGVPYAAVHQYGGGNNIPARPYFPINSDGTPTEYTRQAVLEAAERAVKEEL